jgi:DNA-binding transcriptional regulator YiaG
MTLLRALANVDVPGSEPERPRHRLLLVLQGRARQIEVHLVLAGLLLLGWKEPDPEPGVIARQQRNAVLGVVGHLPAQHAAPEARETDRAVGIKAEREQVTRHSAPHLRSADLEPQTGHRLLDEHTDAETAEQLNAAGHRSGEGKPFTGRIVLDLRRAHGMPSHLQRLRDRGLLTIDEIATRLGVHHSTIKAWHRAGLLTSHKANDKNVRLFEPPTPCDPRLVARQGSPITTEFPPNPRTEVQCETQALSQESPLLPTERTAPTSSSRWV